MNEKERMFEELVAKYDGLIKSEVKKVLRHELYDDLYQIGLIALWDAQNNFDPTKGYFASYAQKFVRGRLMNYLTKKMAIRATHVVRGRNNS